MVGSLLAGCGGKAWRQARKENTSAAYATFVARQPESPKVSRARLRAEALDWATALERDTSDDYEMFLRAHPHSEHADEARLVAEARAWEEARRDDSVKGYERYLARHAAGAHAEEARQATEEAFYRDAKAADTHEAWSRYLVRYRAGRHVQEASARRDELGWSEAVEGATKAAYADYLRRHPKGAHRDEAEAWIQSLRVHTLQPVLVYRRSPRDAKRRTRDRARYVEGLTLGLLADLGREFTMRPLMVEDDPSRSLPPVQERLGTEEGVGLLEIVVDEAEGRVFEPSGRATDIEGTLSIYAPPTSQPVLRRELKASTPARVRGVTLESLYTEAVGEFVSVVRGVEVPFDQIHVAGEAP